jgi:hypothetical protein
VRVQAQCGQPHCRGPTQSEQRWDCAQSKGQHLSHIRRILIGKQCHPLECAPACTPLGEVRPLRGEGRPLPAAATHAGVSRGEQGQAALEGDAAGAQRPLRAARPAPRTAARARAHAQLRAAARSVALQPRHVQRSLTLPGPRLAQLTAPHAAPCSPKRSPPALHLPGLHVSTGYSPAPACPGLACSAVRDAVRAAMLPASGPME